MKLKNLKTNEEIQIPNGMMWVDEFSWSKAVNSKEYSLNGSLIIESGIRSFGRPITLQSAEDSGWIKRQSVGILQRWAESLQELEFTDISGEAHKVMFDNSSDESVSFQPVSGFTDGISGEWYYGSVKLFEIGN